MASIIKTGTTSIAGAIVKGSFSYFSGSTADLGPTSTTGFYEGIDAPASGYTIYQTGGPNGWTAKVALNDSQANNYLINAGATGATLSDNLTWAANTNSVFVATPVTIGQSAFGGIVGYILQPSDPGYDSTQQHGLILASGITATATKWSVANSGFAGATGSTLGTGMNNTNKIINFQGSSASTYAAGKARAVRDGGYTDWYLPSNDELQKICDTYNAGGALLDTCWMSTETATGVGAGAIALGACATNSSFSKVNNLNVRAVRSF